MRLRSKILFSSIVCIFLCGTIAFAMNDNMFSQMGKIQDIQFNKLTSKELNKEFVSDDGLLKLLKKQNLDEDELQYTTEKFFEMTLIHPFDNKDLTTIKKLVKNGANLSKIIDIYNFLYNSNASLEYVEDMYYYGEKVDFYGRYWIEDAFNHCSGQKEYELSMAEVQEYINEGISTDDICVANIISRNEEKNIKEILAEKQSGKNWGGIIDEVYSDTDLSDIKYEENGNVILECIKLSKISNEPIKEIYNDYKEHPQKTTNDIIVPKILEAEKKVKELNLNVSESDTYFNELKEEIGELLSDSEIKNLVQQKYTKSEIKKAAIVSEIDGRKIENILAENEEMNNLNAEGGHIDE